ncbi:MAG: hypothetical protein DI582_07860 [Azospirillum brasilense]|nr:MAG: hypothetical protein DI582_07860 [Azospirillum brasilense]
MRTVAHGFTLLELAVVLAMIALMAGFSIEATKINVDYGCAEKTQGQINTIQTALQHFVDTNRRYPKPSWTTLGSNASNFGMEATEGADPADVAYATRVPAGMVSHAGVLMGTVPHTTLGLPVEMAADCWGNKFSYAVTNTMTSSNSTNGYLSNNVGSITINGNVPTAPVLLSDKAAYIVLSHGPDKDGATPLSATNIAARSCTASNSKTDTQNCDNGDAVFFVPLLTKGEAATGGFFDDIVAYNDALKPKNCAAQGITWPAGCSATVPALLHNQSQTGVANTASGYGGAADVRCNDGTLNLTNTTCNRHCEPQTVNWGAGCSFTTATTINYGQTDSLTNGNPGYSGTVNVMCDQTTGILSQTAPICNANCGAGSTSWAGTVPGCAGSYGALTHGSSTTVSNASAGLTGSVTVSCSNNTITQSGASCENAIPIECPAQTINWGSCSGSIGVMSSGSDVTVTNVNSGFTGTSGVHCDNGNISLNSQSCNASCTAGSTNWLTNCSGNHATLPHGGSVSVSNTVSGYSGSVTLTCNSGSLSQSSASCDAGPVLPCDGSVAGQASCPTGQCFFWVSGGVAGEGQRIGQPDFASNMVGPGEYADSYGSDSNPGPFYRAGVRSFDAIALGSGTRLIIYGGKNFTGTVFADIQGPLYLQNAVYGSVPNMPPIPEEQNAAYSSLPLHNQSERKYSDQMGFAEPNMHYWSGVPETPPAAVHPSAEVTPGEGSFIGQGGMWWFDQRRGGLSAPPIDRGGEGGSVKVICN